MKGHPTPMGVFSIIQKHKLHHSNIYSGAPMPFMQRITWSGIAMHAGVLPGYPASHGCIRMPMAFAARMWNWTKMGARVIVTPGEITPASFSHPLLAEQKVAPQQPHGRQRAEAGCAAGRESRQGRGSRARGQAATSEASLELRSTVGHAMQDRFGREVQRRRASRPAPPTPAAHAGTVRSRCPMPRRPRPAMLRSTPPRAEAKSESRHEPEAEPAAAKPDQPRHPMPSRESKPSEARLPRSSLPTLKPPTRPK